LSGKHDGDTFTAAELADKLGVSGSRARAIIRDGDIGNKNRNKKWCEYVGKRELIDHKGTVCRPMEYRVIKGAK